MRRFRFYTSETNLKSGKIVFLTEDESKHIREVLRLKSGDIIYIFNGEGEYKAEVQKVTSKETSALIVELYSTNEAKSKELTLFQALIKNQNFDLILQKVTEIGIDRIIPFESDYSELSIDKIVKKVDRWKKIIISAAKQSERIEIPDIEEPMEFYELGEYLKTFDLILFLTTQEDKQIKGINEIEIEKFKNIAIIIGPEGGFSPKEENLASEWNITKVTLGKNILKSETAAIVATGIIQARI